MKGAILVRYNPATTVGGTEIFARDFIPLLAQQPGIEELSVVHGGSGGGVVGPDKVADQGLGEPSLPYIGSGIYFSKLLRQMGKLQGRSLDFILSLGSIPGSAYLHPKLGSGTRLLTYAIDSLTSEFRERSRVAKEEGSGRQWSRYLPFRLAERISMWRSDFVITTSRRTAEDLRHEYRIPREKIRTAYLGVREDFARGVTPVQPPRPTFLHIATDPRRKGTYHLLQATQKVRATGRNFAVIICGSPGPFYLRAASRLGLEGCAEFLGRVPREKLIQAYGGCTALVCPSVSEGFCLPVIEAALLRKATIASDAGSLPELVMDNSDGLIVARGDVGGLASAMTRLIDDPELALRLGENAFRKAQAFTLERRVQAFNQILQDVTRGG